MKILLIGFTKLAYMPYMNFYLEEFIKVENEVHVLYWNRDEKDDIKIDSSIVLHEFKRYQEDEIHKIFKIGSFFKFRSKVLSLLRKNEYDLLVVMHTLPAVMMFDILTSSYKKRFILDYRDITFEKILVFRKLIHRLTKSALLTFVSSDAFRDVLPKLNNVYTSHNLLMEAMNFRDVRRYSIRDRVPIRIRFWGFIRHEEVNKKIILKFANDPRFELHYHGREQETANNLKKFCINMEIENVCFHGEYKPTDRYLFASNTDLIHNFYENDNKTDKAMGNKYYDGIIFYIPQLCNKDSQMGKMVTKSKLGYVCVIDDENLSDKIFEYYNTTDWHKFEKNCDFELGRIIKEYKLGKNAISQAIKQKQNSF